VRRIGVGQHGRKTDRLDAEAIAWAVERDQIPLAHLSVTAMFEALASTKNEGRAGCSEG
jgi:hypothetical protein